MPNEPRVPTEPTLEELSAYLDQELNDDVRARVAAHVAGCADCKTRLDGLRQTAYAIRALPMEAPPRAFTVPAKRRELARWAPVAGWIGGVAAAMVVIVVGVQQLHFPGPAATSTAGSGSNLSGSLAQGAPYREVSPLEWSGQPSVDTATHAFSANSKTVNDAQSSSRSLTISTNAMSYPASGVITVHVTTRGLSAQEASSVRIFLIQETGQGGYLVRLVPPSNATTFPIDYEASYSIPQMKLPAPVAGKYTLQVTIDTSDHAGLVAWLPLTITP
jgi:Putative zinc-finger